MKLVIKVGTQSILSEKGVPIESVLESLVEQIATLQKQGHKVVFVSSGAVGFGRSIAQKNLGKNYGVSIGEKQLLASLGQHELMRIYANMFKKHHYLTSQLLLTKQDFHTRRHYLNIARLIHEIHGHEQIIPIANENDSVSIEELMFTDNDELAGLIATLINADKLIILSNIEGVYTGHPQEPGSELIPVIDPEKEWPNVASTKSTHGRGGMISKLSTAKKMSKLGIVTHIASINQKNILLRLVEGESVGTTILTYKKKSTMKRWVAYSSPTGKIHVNQCLYGILQENKRVTSILPVGIESYTGHFAKGDVVEILGPRDERVGIGIAKYESHKLGDFVGQKNKPVFIHYDYLYIF